MVGVTELGPFIIKRFFLGSGRGTLSSIHSDLKSFMVPEEKSIKIHTKMIVEGKGGGHQPSVWSLLQQLWGEG